MFLLFLNNLSSTLSNKFDTSLLVPHFFINGFLTKSICVFDNIEFIRHFSFIIIFFFGKNVQLNFEFVPRTFRYIMRIPNSLIPKFLKHINNFSKYKTMQILKKRFSCITNSFFKCCISRYYIKN